MSKVGNNSNKQIAKGDEEIKTEVVVRKIAYIT